MRTKGMVSVVVFIFVAALSPHARSQSNSDEQAIRSLLRRMEDANNRGDVDGWVSLFDADAVYMPPGGPSVVTREGLIDIARAGFRNKAAVRLEPLEVRVFGDWAFARTHVTGSVTLQSSGTVVPVDVKEIGIFRRGDDREWRVARLINNSNTE